MTPSVRNLSYDLLRSVALLYIIVIRHADDYASNILDNKLVVDVTHIALAIFIFISGKFLYQSFIFKKDKKIIEFVINRFLRIYPLYLIALLMFQQDGLTDSANFIPNAFLYGIFLGKQPITLWFIQLIFIYYLLFCFVIHHNLRVRLIIAFLFLFSLKIFLPEIHPGVIIFWPIFAMGLIQAKYGHKASLLTKNKYVFIQSSTCILSLAFSYYYIGNSSYINLLSRWFFLVCSIFPLIELSKLVVNIFNNSRAFNSFVTSISFASFCMYLFHRIIFTSLLKAYTPPNDYYILIYLSTIGVCVTYFISKYIQSIYNYITNFFFRHV